MVPEREMRGVLKCVKKGVTVEFVDELPEFAMQVGSAGGIKQYVINKRERGKRHQRDYRTRMKGAGYTQVTVWVKAKNVTRLKEVANEL